MTKGPQVGVPLLVAGSKGPYDRVRPMWSHRSGIQLGATQMNLHQPRRSLVLAAVARREERHALERVLRAVEFHPQTDFVHGEVLADRSLKRSVKSETFDGLTFQVSVHTLRSKDRAVHSVNERDDLVRSKSHTT